jgi:hypothetical protein
MKKELTFDERKKLRTIRHRFNDKQLLNIFEIVKVALEDYSTCYRVMSKMDMPVEEMQTIKYSIEGVLK